MGLRWRITLPLLALIAVVLGGSLLLSVRLVERAVERRFQAQADNLGRLMSSRGFPVNDASLAYIREAYGAEVEIVRDGRPPGRDGRYVVRAPLEGGAQLELRYPAEIVERERAAAVRPVLLGGAIVILLAALLGLLLAHAVARPIERLAERASAAPVPRVGGGPEIDALVDALNRMAAEIRRSEQFAVMGRMAAAVAHEIRNPLAAMKINVQMLREGASDREPYDMLLREIERLELAAGELAGRSERSVRERVPLADVVDQVLDLVGPQLRHLGVSLEKRYEDSRAVELDVSRFKRAVLNLVLNGAQAMPAGGTLTVTLASSGNGSVRFSVGDRGPGIPAEIRDRIFEPFVTTKRDGVGLGLVLTRQIVEENGGKIGFETSPSGTTFTVELPAHG